jgi:transposase, IS5 family
VHGKCGKQQKRRALDWRGDLYKKRVASPEFVDFYLPFGGRLRADNRWVQMSRIIPWDVIEPRYANKFSKKKGRRAKSVRVALGALIIKEKKNLTDEETIEEIQENPYLQYFLGFDSYQEDPIFEASLMVYFRKRLGPEILAEVNELIAKQFVERKKCKEDDTEDDKDDNQDTEGQLILDATCIPQDIRFPNDVGLLDDAREKLEGIIDTLYAESDLKKKPRTYRIRARKQYLTFARGKRRTRGADPEGDATTITVCQT